MISTAFAAALAAGRSSFNGRVRDAQRRHAGFRPELFRQFLEDGVGPVADAVAVAEPARLPAVVDAAYDIALGLTVRGLAGPGARGVALTEAWSSLLPFFAGLIAAQPAQVLAMLSNAIIYMDALPGIRRSQWMDEMAALAPEIVSSEQLRIAGQILAWRAGAAHFRAGAIAAAAALPEALALRAFAADGAGSWPALRAAIEHDPWWGGGDPHAVRERAVGSFSGFGGPFAVPPDIRAGSGDFVVRSGERHYLLVADAYGAVLQPASAREFEQAVPAAGQLECMLSAGALAVGTRRIVLDVPETGLAVCATACTIAIASPWTHTIRLFAREDA
jgi:hypothetical protein